MTIFKGDLEMLGGLSSRGTSTAALDGTKGVMGLLRWPRKVRAICCTKFLSKEGLPCFPQRQLNSTRQPVGPDNKTGKGSALIHVMAVSSMRVQSWQIHLDSYMKIGTDHELCEGCFVVDPKRVHHRHDAQPKQRFEQGRATGRQYAWPGSVCGYAEARNTKTGLQGPWAPLV